MWWLLAASAAAIALLLLLRPRDAARPAQPYFTELNTELLARRMGRPCILLDLDRLDSNLALARSRLPRPDWARVVVKSLPCLPLLRYVLAALGSRRLMVFHPPFLPLLLEGLPEDTDLLLGKPLPLRAVEELFQALPAAARRQAAGRLQWLADTPQRVEELRGLARRLGLRLRVSLEIDTGLHRGGAGSPPELTELLGGLAADPGALRFSGLLGYDGHVPHAPALPGARRAAAARALDRTLARYAELAQAGRAAFPELFAGTDGPLTFNAGGSGSFCLYRRRLADSPVNDLALGGGLLATAAYRSCCLEGFRPALHIACPVLKKQAGLRLPFLRWLGGALCLWDPNLRLSYVVYGGGWAAELVSPPGVRRSPLSDPPNQNLLPNQTLLHSSPRVSLEVGGFVFYRPVQSDAMFQFQELLLLRAGRLAGRWPSFPVGY